MGVGEKVNVIIELVLLIVKRHSQQTMSDLYILQILLQSYCHVIVWEIKDPCANRVLLAVFVSPPPST
jgi:hypothetical protein